MSGTLPAGDAISSRLVGWRLLVPDNPWIIRIIGALLEDLAFSDSWIPSEGITADAAANMMQEVADSLNAFPDLTGMVMAWTHPLTTYPDGVLPCDGALYLQTEYPDLYAIIGRTFTAIGDPSDQFRVPDLRGRGVLGAGAGPGLTERQVADTIGAESVSLGTNELPTHSHTDSGHIHSIHTHGAGVALTPGELPVALPEFPTEATSSGNANIQNAGNGAAFDIMNPALVLRWVIISGARIA